MTHVEVYTLEKLRNSFQEEIQKLKEALIKTHYGIEEIRLFQGQAKGLDRALSFLYGQYPFLKETKRDTETDIILIKESLDDERIS